MLYIKKAFTCVVGIVEYYFVVNIYVQIIQQRMYGLVVWYFQRSLIAKLLSIGIFKFIKF